MTLSPNPSVQVNRYTYANASPLTHTDPTGHWAVEGNPASGGSGWQDWAPSSGNSIPTAATANPDEGWICGSWGGCFRVSNPLYSWGSSNIGDGRIAEDDPFWHFENFIVDNITLGSRAAAPMDYAESSLEDRQVFWIGYVMGLSASELADLWRELRSAGGLSRPGNINVPDPGCGPAGGDKCKQFLESHHVKGNRWVKNKPVKPPRVSNEKLREILNGIYETDKIKGAVIGNGTVAAAVEHELRTGLKVGEKYHLNKAADSAAGLAKLLESARKGEITLTPSDKFHATREFARIWQVLNRANYHPEVEVFFSKNPGRLAAFNNSIAKSMRTEAVKGVTGQVFRPGTDKGNNPNAKNNHVPGAGKRPGGFVRGMVGLGNKLGALGSLLWVLSSASCASDAQCANEYIRTEYGGTVQ
jgi:hypothetical protein